MVTILLISGASGSGKSTIAKKVADSMVNRKVEVLQQDNYFSAEFRPYHQRHDFSFENGFGIDWDRLTMDMEAGTNSCTDSDSVIIVEGHMLGAAAPKFFDSFESQASIVLVFIHCPKEICKARRLSRQKRSDQEWEELNTYIDNFVWPCFVEIGMPTMESLKRHADLNRENRDVAILELSTESPDSLEMNATIITKAIHTFQQSNVCEQHEEVTEEWPSLAGDLRGFAQHEVLSIQLDHNQDVGFELECVSSLSLLDMVNLSHGSHDATGHSVWMGAFLFIEALASDVTFAGLATQKVSLRSLFHSKRVLELGCGTGIGALSLLLSPDSWKSKPSHVSFSDNDDEVLDLCHKNCKRYWPPDSPPSLQEPLYSTFTLNWGDAAPSDTGGNLYDTVLATDVLYDMACLRPLLSTSSQSIPENGFFVLAHVPRSCLPDTVSDTHKPKVETDYHAILENHLVETAGELGLQTSVIIRPERIRNATRSDSAIPLNSTSLLEMEEAGAAIFVFQKLCVDFPG